MGSDASTLRSAWSRTRPLHGPALWAAGGLWDYLTLRLDRWGDNLLLAAYLLTYAAATGAAVRRAEGWDTPAWASRWPRATELVGHFCLGGLLSAYFVHYLRGAPLIRSFTWLTLLGGLALIVELADRRAHGPALRVALFTFITFNFTIAAWPLATGQLAGPALPLLVSAGAAYSLLRWARAGRPAGPQVRAASRSAAGAWIVQVMLFATDRVPPLPLVLMGAEVTAADPDAPYTRSAAAELLAPVGWFEPSLPWSAREAVRVHTPVYLPAGMSADVVHHWLRHDGDTWVTSDRIPLAIRGGREAGFRTWSLKRKTQPGSWQVRVETDDGREIGRVSFRLFDADDP